MMKTLASATVYSNSHMNFMMASNRSWGSFCFTEVFSHISNIVCLKKEKNLNIGLELALQLRAFGSIPSTHMVAFNSVTPVPGEVASSDLYGTMHALVQTDMQASQVL